jgi:transposase
MLTKKDVQERQERFESIYNMYFAGYSYRQIAHEFSISAERVRQILHQYASPTQRIALHDEISKRRETSWQSKEIEYLLEAGNTCKTVANILNVSIDVVKRVSARHRRTKLETARS